MGDSQASVSASIGVRRRLVSGGAAAFFAKVASMLATVGMLALLARVLEPGPFGTYVVIMSLINVAATVGALGLPQTATRLIATERSGRSSGSAARIAAMAVVGAGAGSLILTLLYVSVGHGPLTSTILGSSAIGLAVPIATWFAATAMQRVLGEALRGYDEVAAASLFATQNLGLVTVAVGFAGLLIAETSVGLDLRRVVTIMALAAWFGAAIGLVLLWRRSRRREPGADPTAADAPAKRGWREVLVVAWPILVSSVTLFVITQGDVWILSAIGGPTEVASYGAALRLVNLVTLPLLIANAVLPPVIARWHAEGERSRLEQVLRSIATLTGLPSAVALVLVIAFAPQVLGVIFGAYYADAAVILRLLAIGQFANVLTGSCGQVLLMTGHERTVMGLTVGLGTASLAAAVLATQAFGPTGLAAAMAAGLVAQNVAKLLFARYLAGVWSHVTVSPRLIRDTLRSLE